MSKGIDAQRRGIRNTGNGKFLWVILVRRKKQIEGSSTLYLGIQVPGCPERHGHFDPSAALKSTRQLAQRVVEVRCGRDGDFLGNREPRSEGSNHQEQPDFSHQSCRRVLSPDLLKSEKPQSSNGSLCRPKLLSAYLIPASSPAEWRLNPPLTWYKGAYLCTPSLGLLLDRQNHSCQSNRGDTWWDAPNLLAALRRLSLIAIN